MTSGPKRDVYEMGSFRVRSLVWKKRYVSGPVHTTLVFGDSLWSNMEVDVFSSYKRTGRRPLVVQNPTYQKVKSVTTVKVCSI